MTATTAPSWPTDGSVAGIRPLARVLWRGVEAQHLVATMKLVDSLDEQAELERMLEASNPPWNAAEPSWSEPADGAPQ